MLRSLLLNLLLLPILSWATPLTARDATLQIIRIAQPAQRIVSLAPDLTEILFAIGAGSKVVAVSVDSDYPLAAKQLPIVGGYQSINVEAIVALHPDLVVAWTGNPAVDLALLKKLGIPVYLENDQSFADIAATMQNLGVLAGLSQTAEAAAQNFMAKYQALRRQYTSARPVKVFLEIDDAPLYTLSDKTLQGKILSLCGGQNIFANVKASAAEVSVESVLAANPEVMIATSPINLDNWQKWPEIIAVQHHALYVINGDLLSRNGPRLIDGARQVCQWLQTVRMNTR